MKQYCRYCINLVVGDVAYCEVKKKVLSRDSCKRPNECKDFEFANVDPELQDAFGETNGYKPREPKKKQCDGQIRIDEMTFGCPQTDEELPFVEVK